MFQYPSKQILAYRLKHSSIPELLNYIIENNIQVHCTISKCIILADIFQVKGINSRIDTPDPLTQEVADEIGINYRHLHVSYAAGELKIYGIDTSNMSSKVILSSMVYLWYNRRLPVPPAMWYTGLKQFNTPLGLSQANFSELYNTFDDISPEEYLSYHINNSSDATDIVQYQLLSDLLTTVEGCAPEKKYFKTKVGVINALIRNEVCYYNIIFAMLGLFKKRWWTVEREIYTNGIRHEDIPSVNHRSLTYIPPNRFEKEYCELRQAGMDDKSVITTLMNRYDIGPDVVNWTFVETGKAVTEEYLVDLIQQNKKELLTIPCSVIKKLLRGPIANDRKALLNYINWTSFIIIPSDLCSNKEDMLGTPFVGVRVIGYGPFNNRRCYSLDELKLAFYEPDSGRYIFRKPDNPKSMFKLQEIRDLIFLTKDKYFKTAYDEVVRRMNIQNLSDIDKPILMDMLKFTFEAGMYQRTWHGPGTSYPMLSSEAQGDYDIAAGMTYALNNIKDLYETLTPEGQDIWDNLHTVDFNGIKTSFISKDIDDIISGSYCIGLASTPLVMTGWYYLNELGVGIDNFDISQFEPGSRHREGMLH